MDSGGTELIVDESSALEPLSLREAKQHLRSESADLDEQIVPAISEWREWCEVQVNRTIRTEVERKVYWQCWPQFPIWLPWPPLISVEAMEYYDASNVLQTVDSSDYAVYLSKNQQSRIQMVDSWSAPTTYDREDAVSVRFKCGYETIDKIPQCVKRAMKIMLAVEFDDVPPPRENNARQRARDCLNTLRWGGYR